MYFFFKYHCLENCLIGLIYILYGMKCI